MYLIDGHNLIAHMPWLDLADPNDEAKLVLILRQFVARTGKKMMVVFDSGLPGGLSHRLSSHSIKVLFAPAGHSADRVLIRRLEREKHPGQLTLVSSDQEVIRVAAARKIRVMHSAEFIESLAPAPGLSTPTDEIKPEHPRISAAEVDEWLHIFDESS